MINQIHLFGAEVEINISKENLINTRNIKINDDDLSFKESKGTVFIDSDKELFYTVSDNNLKLYLLNQNKKDIDVEKTFTFKELNTILTNQQSERFLTINLKQESDELLFVISCNGSKNKQIILNKNLEIIDRIDKEKDLYKKVNLTTEEAEKLINTDIFYPKNLDNELEPYIYSIPYSDENIFVFTVYYGFKDKWGASGFYGYNGWGYYIYETKKTVYYEQNFANIHVFDSKIVFDTITYYAENHQYYPNNCVTVFDLNSLKVNNIYFSRRNFHQGAPIILDSELKYFAIISLGKSGDTYSYDKRILDIYNINTKEKVMEYDLYISNVRSGNYDELDTYPKVYLSYLSKDLKKLQIDVVDDAKIEGVYPSNIEGLREIYEVDLELDIKKKDNPQTTDNTFNILILICFIIIILLFYKDKKNLKFTNHNDFI